jgi:hypothetical protein
MAIGGANACPAWTPRGANGSPEQSHDDLRRADHEEACAGAAEVDDLAALLRFRRFRQRRANGCRLILKPIPVRPHQACARQGQRRDVEQELEALVSGLIRAARSSTPALAAISSRTTPGRQRDVMRIHHCYADGIRVIRSYSR